MAFNNLYDFGKGVIMKLRVNGRQMYEAVGLNCLAYIDWKGTLRNTDFQTDELTMDKLPRNLQKAKGLVRQCAELQFKGADIIIN